MARAVLVHQLVEPDDGLVTSGAIEAGSRTAEVVACPVRAAGERDALQPGVERRLRRGWPMPVKSTSRRLADTPRHREPVGAKR